jgi:hypothetical protein
MVTDQPPVTREEFEALQARVAEMEDRLAEQQRYEDVGLDRRDATVLDALTEGDRYQKRALVKLYTGLTDITNPKTAKRRAKSLEQRSFFDHVGGELLFTGGPDG